MSSSSWLIPDWPVPSGVHAVCSTRAGGVSRGNYQGLNLGDHVGDEPEHVRANRAVLRQGVGARPVFLQQVHGTHVAALDGSSTDGIVADASTTTEGGVACTIMVADCLPVLFTDAAGRRIAAAHAGWRGLAGGVLERTIESFGSDAYRPDLMAWLGPCIGPDAFEVGDEVRAAFEPATQNAATCFKPATSPDKWLADLSGLARQRLRAAGVKQLYGNDSSEDWCTVHNPLRFFSHRRDRISGRFAACIWRD